MPHFFVKSTDKSGNQITISDRENYQHIAKSLRARVGEKLLLIDENQTQYETFICSIDNKSIIVDIDKEYKSERWLKFKLYLAQSPLRSDAQNFIVEKATELGVSGIYPIFTDNCALKKSIIQNKIEKWQKTMFEASKQCERANIPTCFEMTTLDKLIQDKKFDKIVAFTERQADMNLREFFDASPVQEEESLLVIIGPEGGFSKEEFDFLTQNNIPKLTLGDLILKAETAVTVALGNIVYEFENYRKN